MLNQRLLAAVPRHTSDSGTAPRTALVVARSGVLFVQYARTDSGCVYSIKFSGGGGWVQRKRKGVAWAIKK